MPCDFQKLNQQYYKWCFIYFLQEVLGTSETTDLNLVPRPPASITACLIFKINQHEFNLLAINSISSISRVG